MSRSPRKPRADAQLSGLAGELFVAAELLKRGLQVSITFGNAKAIDLLVHNPKIPHTFAVQVKALRQPNFFLLGRQDVRSTNMYVFVLLNKPDTAVRYFVVPGSVLVGEPERFGKYFQVTKMPGIHSKVLEAMPEYANGWHHFQRALPASPSLAIQRTDRSAS